MASTRKPAKGSAKKAAKSTPAGAKKAKGFSEEERAAMKERARELEAEARRGARADEGEKALLAKVAEMPKADRVLAERLHAIVKTHAPGLAAKTWYGMPAYANAAGKVVLFFQSASKFKSRYASFGFTDEARLDDGAMWPTYFALKELDAAVEARMVALVKKAVG
jgi:uncharacterized protein YdhG (YjbR/CyaY superfamily)